MKKISQTAPTVPTAQSGKPDEIKPGQTKPGQKVEKTQPQKSPFETGKLVDPGTNKSMTDVSKETGTVKPTTASQRKDSRHKFAASVESKMKYSEMIGKAHPKSDTQLGGISGTSEAVVEGIDSIHEDMMKAVSEEPKVKKAAEQLDKLIKAGKVNSDHLDTMVKEGLDKDVVSYWKKYYGQVDGGSEFAAALTKDYSSAKSEKKAAEDVEVYKAKFAKAYDLAYDMADAGMISKNNSAIKTEAEKIINYTDHAYESMKRVVAHHMASMKKTASVQVGVALDSPETVLEPSGGSLYDNLVSAFSGRKY